MVQCRRGRHRHRAFPRRLDGLRHRHECIIRLRRSLCARPRGDQPGRAQHAATTTGTGGLRPRSRDLRAGCRREHERPQLGQPEPRRHRPLRDRAVRRRVDVRSECQQFAGNANDVSSERQQPGWRCGLRDGSGVHFAERRSDAAVHRHRRCRREHTRHVPASQWPDHRRSREQSRRYERAGSGRPHRSRPPDSSAHTEPHRQPSCGREPGLLRCTRRSTIRSSCSIEAQQVSPPSCSD